MYAYIQFLFCPVYHQNLYFGDPGFFVKVTQATIKVLRKLKFANEFDALLVALNQLRLNSYYPDVIVVNTDDFVKMVLLKHTANTHLRGTLGTSLQKNIQGVNVMQSTAVTSGTYYVMDSARYGRYYNRESLTVRVGYDGNDFSSGTRIAIAVHRGASIPS